MTAQFRPVAEGIFQTRPHPHLLGGRHRETGRYVFPMPSGMEAQDYDRVPLQGEGTLWSWTIQRFRPKSPPYAGPEAFEPYAVGYIELAGQVIVESRLVDVDFDTLRIGDRFRTVIEPFTEDADGTKVLTFAFAPVKGDAL